MYLVHIRFGSPVRGCEKEKAEEVVQEFIGALIWSGQLCEDAVYSWFEGVLGYYVNVPRPTSLEERYMSSRAEEGLAQVVEVFGEKPTWHLMQDEVPKRFRSWKRASFLFLFSHAFREGNYVCCGDSGEGFPPYLLPVTTEWRCELRRWGEKYRDHDRVWLSSCALEMPAYKQMADPASALAEEGRQLCTRLEAAVGKPVFYYLQRYWGRIGKETLRKCPGCGGDWAIENNEDRNGMVPFDFRCDGCRLVSHEAVSFEDERHARIGEWRPG